MFSDHKMNTGSGILVHEVPGLFTSYGISVFGVWEILTKKNA